MKVVFVVKTLDNVQGGAERVLSNVVNGLAQRGHDIEIITFDKSDVRPFYAFAERVVFKPLNIGRTRESATLSESIARMNALRKTTREAKPDIVVAFMHSSFVLTSFALIGTGVSVIASEHIVPVHYKCRPVEFLLVLFSVFFIKRITVLSETVKMSYPWFLQRKMVAITNPVEPAVIPADPVAESRPRKIILNVGRLDVQKDQKTLIRAFSGLASGYPDWDVRIVGEGKLREELETLVRALDMRKRIFLPGMTSEIDQEYQNAQIFAFPSRYESFGLAAAEGMAHALPVIGFADCSGINELIVHRQNGLLISGADRVAGFRSALEELIGDPAERTELGNNANFTMQRFTQDKVVRQWEVLLLNTL